MANVTKIVEYTEAFNDFVQEAALRVRHTPHIPEPPLLNRYEQKMIGGGLPQEVESSGYNGPFKVTRHSDTSVFVKGGNVNNYLKLFKTFEDTEVTLPDEYIQESKASPDTEMKYYVCLVREPANGLRIGFCKYFRSAYSACTLARVSVLNGIIQGCVQMQTTIPLSSNPTGYAEYIAGNYGYDVFFNSSYTEDGICLGINVSSFHAYAISDTSVWVNAGKLLDSEGNTIFEYPGGQFKLPKNENSYSVAYYFVLREWKGGFEIFIAGTDGAGEYRRNVPRPIVCCGGVVLYDKEYSDESQKSIETVLTTGLNPIAQNGGKVNYPYFCVLQYDENSVMVHRGIASTYNNSGVATEVISDTIVQTPIGTISYILFNPYTKKYFTSRAYLGYFPVVATYYNNYGDGVIGIAQDNYSLQALRYDENQSFAFTPIDKNVVKINKGNVIIGSNLAFCEGATFTITEDCGIYLQVTYANGKYSAKLLEAHYMDTDKMISDSVYTIQLFSISVGKFEDETVFTRISANAGYFNSYVKNGATTYVSRGNIEIFGRCV